MKYILFFLLILLQSCSLFNINQRIFPTHMYVIKESTIISYKDNICKYSVYNLNNYDALDLVNDRFFWIASCDEFKVNDTMSFTVIKY